MNLDVHAFGLSLSDPLALHIHKRIESALRPFRKAVAGITARLTDINARRGGIDKQCSLVVVLHHQASVVVQGLHSDAYRSVDQAAGRLRSALSRAVNRHKWHEQSRRRS